MHKLTRSTVLQSVAVITLLGLGACAGKDGASLSVASAPPGASGSVGETGPGGSTGDPGTPGATGGTGGSGSGTTTPGSGAGTVTVTAAGTSVTTPGILGNTGNVLATSGNSLLPLGGTGAKGSSSTTVGTSGPVPVSVTLNGGGSASTPGSSALPGNLGNVAGATVGNNSILGTGGATPALGLSAASDKTRSGSVATVGALNKDGTSVSVNTGALTSATGSPTSVLGTSNGLVTGTTGNSTLLNGGASPLLGASVASPTQAQGTAASAGVLTNGQAATVKTGTLPLPTGH